MAEQRQFASINNTVRFYLTDPATGALKTGLTFSSSGLIISSQCDNESSPVLYTAAGSTIETITTLGTFSTPTATKCRFKEVDSTNRPGYYEFQFADARFAVSSAHLMDIAVTGASATGHYQLQLVSFDPYAAPLSSQDIRDSMKLAATAGSPAANSIDDKLTTITTDITQQWIRTNTAQTATPTTITLDSGASASNNFYNNCLIMIISGTGAGQARFITGYVGATKVATVGTWVTNPNSTSGFIIYPYDSLAGSSVPSVAQISAAIWKDLTGGGDFGTAGSIGALLVADIDAAISTRTKRADSLIVGTNNDKTGYSLLAGQLTVKKNTALANFPFIMKDAVTHAPSAGLTVAATRSIDGGAFASCANSPTGVSSGSYKINLAASDLNGTTIMLRFTSATADDTFVSILTQA